MTLDQFNDLEPTAQHAVLEKCCGARQWITQMISRAPFSGLDHLLYFADYNWENAHEESWKEAFTHHEMIEGDETQEDLIEKKHQEYEKKFGYPFIISKSYNSIDDIQKLLQERLLHSEEDELIVAMKEQQRITKSRLIEVFGGK